MTSERELRVILSTVTMAIGRPVMQGRPALMTALRDAANMLSAAITDEQHKAFNRGGDAA